MTVLVLWVSSSGDVLRFRAYRLGSHTPHITSAEPQRSPEELTSTILGTSVALSLALKATGMDPSSSKGEVHEMNLAVSVSTALNI